MKNRAFSFIFFCCFLTGILAQNYSSFDSLALLAIDFTCDANGNLNWNTEPDPGKWEGVTWSSTVPKLVTELAIGANGLIGTLDVRSLFGLVELKCESNQLTGLIITGLPNLTWVNCDDNQITDMVISDLPRLIFLDCPYNELSDLNVSGITSLEILNCSDNNLTNLNVSGLVNLTVLEFFFNQLVAVDVSSLTNLHYLDCSGNQLASLDITHLKNLVELFCMDNHLASLDLSGSINLAHLFCDGNQLTSLDVSGAPDLSWLTCSSNQLTSLDLSMLMDLHFLECSNNRLPFSSLGTAWRAQDLFCTPQDTLFESDTITGDILIDYSEEADIRGTLTQFIFYKDQQAIDTNNTGLFYTEGSGVYHCEMTNALFPELTLTTETVTILPLGIDGKEQECIGIYPNPVTDILNLDIPYDTYEIEMCNVEGRTLYKAGYVTEIDMSDYAAGIYYVKVSADDEVWVGRVVKR